MLVLVDRDLREVLRQKVLCADIDLNDFVQPSSIEIPLGDRAYLVKQKFLPFRQNVSYIVEKLKLEEFDLNKGVMLHKGFTYLVPCLKVYMPSNFLAKISPKSSIGRVDLMVRAVIDNSGLYDTILPGTSGELWLEISPQSFNIFIKKGCSLSQIRIFELIDNVVDFKDDVLLYDENENPLPNKIFDNKLILSLAVPSDGVAGYEALPINDVVDITSRDHVKEKYFRVLDGKGKGRITLEKDKFYILTTKEKVSVPAKYSIEMVPFSHLVGELRAHYAGFFDPGFGGEKGAVGVLEIRPHETLTVYDGQPICLMEIYANKSMPETLYGEAQNNYQHQKGPRLAKYFLQ